MGYHARNRSTPGSLSLSLSHTHTHTHTRTHTHTHIHTHLAASELEGTQRVRDVFNGVHDAVCVVVSRVDAPGVTGTRVWLLLDAVGAGVPHGTIVVVQVLLQSEVDLSFLELAGLHGTEQAEVLFHGALAEWTDGSFRQRRRAFLFAGHLRLGAIDVELLEEVARGLDFGLGLSADVRIALLDELLGKLVQLIEVVGGVGHPAWVVPEPVQVLDDHVDVLLLLRCGVGVVEPQETLAAIDFSHEKVEVDGLRMADVEVSVGFWGEASLPLAAGGLQVSGQIFGRVHGVGARLDRAELGDLVILGRNGEELAHVNVADHLLFFLRLLLASTVPGVGLGGLLGLHFLRALQHERVGGFERGNRIVEALVFEGGIPLFDFGGGFAVQVAVLDLFEQLRPHLLGSVFRCWHGRTAVGLAGRAGSDTRKSKHASEKVAKVQVGRMRCV